MPVEEFCRRVAERTSARPRTAEWDASAVLWALADSVSGGGGELNQHRTSQVWFGARSFETGQRRAALA
jgi:hypothetical protein